MTVGIRELKAHLSRYLRYVQAGTSIDVTQHGRAVATIHPAGAPAENLGWLRQMAAEGIASWSGGKPGGLPPVRRRRGSRPTSEIIIEDRR